MKKILFIAVVLLMVACSQDELNDKMVVQTNQSNELVFAELNRQIDDLNERYLSGNLSSANSSLRRVASHDLDVLEIIYPELHTKPVVDPEDDPLKPPVEHKDELPPVVLADLEGKMRGQAIGTRWGNDLGYIGALAGAAATLPFTSGTSVFYAGLLSELGRQAGGVVGSWIGGLIGSNHASNAAAMNSCSITRPLIEDEFSPQIVREFPMYIDAEIPVKTMEEYYDERYIDVYQKIPGADCGVFHNIVMEQLYSQYSVQMMIDAKEDPWLVLDMITDVVEETTGFVIEEEDAKHVLWKTFVNEGQDESWVLETDKEYIEEYLMTIVQLHRSLWKNYTVEYMQLIHDYFRDNHWEEQLMASRINGAISVYFHSRLLWNSYVPDPQLANRFMAFNNKFGVWEIVNKEQLAMGLQRNEVLIYGVPRFVNGMLTGVFFYEEFYENYIFASDVTESIFSTDKDGHGVIPMTEVLVRDGIGVPIHNVSEVEYAVFDTEAYGGRVNFVLFDISYNL